MVKRSVVKKSAVVKTTQQPIIEKSESASVLTKILKRGNQLKVETVTPVKSGVQS